MSLFLGKIHYWLYNKIINFESIEKEIIKWAQEKDLNLQNEIKSLQDEYGAPLDSRPLEEIIDTANIHGWLQNKISKAEIRQAALITSILQKNKEYKEDLVQIYKLEGAKSAKNYLGNNAHTPEKIYHILNDVILEGMPCDSVSEIIERSDNELVWVTTTCLHKSYWDQVGGDINNFYELRDAWISHFIKSLNPKFHYERVNEHSQRIIKL